MSSEIAIKVEQLSKCYHIFDKPHERLLQMLMRGYKQYGREFWALKDVSFEVKKGESVGIIGRNGCGKSTLLQIICGTLNPTKGTVTTHGRIAALLELGSGFNPEFTGRENVYMNASVLGLSQNEINERFDDIVGFADIGDFIDQPIKTYSSGMMVRLAFAVTTQVDPDILIVDEALAVGDLLFQKRCFQRIEQLVSNGTTLLFVSHDQESIRTLTHRTLFLNQGIPMQFGLSSDVIHTYRKHLHEDETIYFTEITQKLANKKNNQSEINQPESNIIKEDTLIPLLGDNQKSTTLDFGDGGVTIEAVKIYNSAAQECHVFYPGKELIIKMYCLSKITTDRLNISLRIRNKEGVKIYSWGTLNQDISLAFNEAKRSIFWKRTINANEEFCVEFRCKTPLGANLYEVQAIISYEDTPDYLSQRVLHWVDESAFFQVSMKQDEYFFGGSTDLRMTASW